MSHTALLRASGQHAGHTYDVGSVLNGDGASVGVPHGEALIEFAEAMLTGDRARQSKAREALHSAMGGAALVDAAAIVASFNSVVKLADGSGIPLEDFKAQATEDLRKELGLESLNHLSG